MILPGCLEVVKGGGIGWKLIASSKSIKSTANKNNETDCISRVAREFLVAVASGKVRVSISHTAIATSQPQHENTALHEAQRVPTSDLQSVALLINVSVSNR